jgi:hypothetical protein
MEPRIVNPDPKYSRVHLIEPTGLGYLHVAGMVRPRPMPLLPRGREMSELLGRLNDLGRQLERLGQVAKVTVYEAIAFAPPSAYAKERVNSVHVPRFDAVVLVETTSPSTARQVRAAPEYAELEDTLRNKARDLHVIAARNIKRVGDVDKTRKGTFLFNYFVGEDPEVVVQLWDYLAGWYEVETGMDNSTLLAPLEGEKSDYVIINHALWDGNPLRFLWRQFPKKSFRSYMLANLEANGVGAMPVLYRLA